MNCLFTIFVYIAISIAEIRAESIQNKIKEYFNSDVVKLFENTWSTFAIAYENTISYTLKEAYGHKTMNVYINRLNKPLLIASGYYHTDNQVQLVMKDMMLEALPHLYDVDISFPLASNVLQIDASVSKIVVHSSYVLFRDQADIIYSSADQDPYKSSPFRYEQVRNVGDLAITIEGCSLSGLLVATLSGTSVNLGHHELRLKDCQYSIEIYKLGSGAPPVIANYLPKGEKGLNLETLLSLPMLDELVPKLQGAMFSAVNTSTIFLNNLPKIRAKQEVLFEDTKNWIDELVRNMNKKSIEKNMGTIELADFSITWDDTFTEIPSAKGIKMSKMSLLGLDTVYASHAGGAIRLTDTEIVEQFRFSTLQVIGKVAIDGFQDDSAFAVEISDLTVDVNIDATMKIKFEILGWRFLEFSCPDLEFLPTESLVVGYLLNEVPKHVQSHLSSVYDSSKVKLSHGDNENAMVSEVDDQFVYEQPIDGTYNMKSHEMIDQQQLNKDLDEGKVKLHHININSNEEPEIVPLNDRHSDRLNIKLLNANVEPYNGEQGNIKLHHVEAVAHEVEQGEVKLHHVEAGAHEIEQGEVKLHHVQAESHEEEQGQVKLHHIQVEPHTEEVNKGTILQLNEAQQENVQVQLHHVSVERHNPAEDGQMKLNHVEAAPQEEESGEVKILNAEAEPHTYKPGPVRLHHIGVVHDDETSNKDEEKKSSKIAARKKNNRKRRMFINPIHKMTKRNKFAREIRRAKKLTAATRKTIYMSDNEVHSN